MFRSSADAAAACVKFNLGPDDKQEFHARPQEGGSMASSNRSASPAGKWLKLARRGGEFTAYRSADGRAWDPVGSTTADVPRDCLVGVFVCSHSATGETCAAVFEGVGVTGGAP
jgi:regulation of enolase protein 1 (concanavalin A-like superfamily)